MAGPGLGRAGRAGRMPRPPVARSWLTSKPRAHWASAPFSGRLQTWSAYLKGKPPTNGVDWSISFFEGVLWRSHSKTHSSHGLCGPRFGMTFWMSPKATPRPEQHSSVRHYDLGAPNMVHRNAKKLQVEQPSKPPTSLLGQGIRASSVFVPRPITSCFPTISPLRTERRLAGKTRPHC